MCNIIEYNLIEFFIIIKYIDKNMKVYGTSEII